MINKYFNCVCKFFSRSKSLEEELVKCRNEITSLEKELSEALHNNLLEYSNRSSGNTY